LRIMTRWGVARAGGGRGAVDVTGGCRDGAQFAGVAGLEKALLTRPELFATTVTEKLLTYALGRGVEFTDARRCGRLSGRLSATISGSLR
jgi:hypothetical protein